MFMFLLFKQYYYQLLLLSELHVKLLSINMGK